MKKVLISLCFLSFSTLGAFCQADGPKAKYRVGPSLVTVWEEHKEGKYGSYMELTFDLEKLYKANDEWRSTNTYTLEELLKLRLAIDRALEEEGVEVE